MLVKVYGDVPQGVHRYSQPDCIGTQKQAGPGRGRGHQPALPQAPDRSARAWAVGQRGRR
jgi:hypothetical protein